MKNFIVIISLLLLMDVSFAQTKTKTDAKPPSQNEMQEMMKEMQKAMDEMSPEDKKAMEEMGVKMPDINSIQKNVSGISDAKLQKTYDDENRIVPEKDEVRIASISKIPLAAATIPAFLSSTNANVIALLKPESKTLAEKLYVQLKSTGSNADAIGNNAAGLWIMGRIQPAIYIMERICSEDINNTDNLSNYASMLSMIGLQQSAIPLLNFLNAKYPVNSTLLNNLGQAWFGLGEMQIAEKYLDSAIRIYAYHPQANLTKSFIEESRGNRTKAIEAIKKSIKHAYTNEKEDMLHKLGNDITLKDLKIPFKPDSDPLGLSGFRQPEYPKSISELKSLKPLWENFNKDCDSKLAQLRAERKDLMDKYEKNLSALKYGVTLPLYYRKGSLKLNEIMEYNETKMKKLSELHLVLAKDLNKIQQTQKKAAPEAPCEEHLSAENDFLKQYNEKKKAFDEQALEVFRHYFNDMAYWSQFTSIDKNQFNLGVLEFQEGWLSKLKEYQPLLQSEFENLECAKDEESKPGKLSEFDDVACKYHSELNLVVGRMKMDCSRWTSEIDLNVIKLGLKQNMDKDTFSDQFIGCTVEVGAKIGKSVKVGPLSVEASAGSRLGIEIDRTGVKDVYVTGGVKAGVSTNIIGEASSAAETPSSMMGVGVSDVSIDGGIEGRISLVSGRGSVYGTGIFGN